MSRVWIRTDSKGRTQNIISMSARPDYYAAQEKKWLGCWSRRALDKFSESNHMPPTLSVVMITQQTLRVRLPQVPSSAPTRLSRCDQPQAWMPYSAPLNVIHYLTLLARSLSPRPSAHLDVCAYLAGSDRLIGIVLCLPSLTAGPIRSLTKFPIRA